MTIMEEATAKKLIWTKENSARAARRSAERVSGERPVAGGETTWWCDCRNISDVRSCRRCANLRAPTSYAIRTSAIPLAAEK